MPKGSLPAARNIARIENRQAFEVNALRGHDFPEAQRAWSEYTARMEARIREQERVNAARGPANALSATAQGGSGPKRISANIDDRRPPEAKERDRRSGFGSDPRFKAGR